VLNLVDGIWLEHGGGTTVTRHTMKTPDPRLSLFIAQDFYAGKYNCSGVMTEHEKQESRHMLVEIWRAHLGSLSSG
jgi:hypothetical protein